jgi:chromosomal replication initiation ATPase DnaA
MEEKITTTIQNFIENNSKNILWIYGRSGCGKTKLANFLSKEFKNKGKKVYSASANSFVGLMIKLIHNQSLKSLVPYCQKYDLVILDDVSMQLFHKLKTQAEIKYLVFATLNNKKTKFVLVSEKRPRKLPALKFHTQNCQYLGLKIPRYETKINLLKSWAKEKDVIISEEVVALMAIAAENLFELKGLFNQFCFRKSKPVFNKK